MFEQLGAYHAPGIRSTARAEAHREFVRKLFALTDARAALAGRPLSAYMTAVEHVPGMPAAGVGLSHIGSAWIPADWDRAEPFPYFEPFPGFPPRCVRCDPGTGRAQVFTTLEGHHNYATVTVLVADGLRDSVRAGLIDLEKQLLNWIAHYHLEPFERWLGEDALASLRHWAGGRDDWVTKGPLGHTTILAPEEPLPLSVVPWNVGGEQRSAARRRMEAEARKQIQEHLNLMANLADESGMQPIQRKRARSGQPANSVADATLDLECLVRSRVLGQSNKRIGRETGRTPRAVSFALTRAAQLLETGAQPTAQEDNPSDG